METIEQIEHNLELSKRDHKYLNIGKRKKELLKHHSPEKCDAWINDVVNVSKKMKHLLTQRFVLFDTETTGFHDSDEIIEFAALDSTDENDNISYMLKPTKPIPQGASNVHNIYDKDVMHCPSFPAMRDATNNFMQRYQLCVAYNAEFDDRLLKQTAFIHNCEPVKIPKIYDPIKDIALWIGVWHKKYNGFRLTKLEGGHRALDDCKQLLKAMQLIASLDVDKLILQNQNE